MKEKKLKIRWTNLIHCQIHLLHFRKLSFDRRYRIKMIFFICCGSSHRKSTRFPATLTDKVAAMRGTQLQQDVPSPIPRTVSTAPFLTVRLADVYQTNRVDADLLTSALTPTRKGYLKKNLTRSSKWSSICLD